MKPAIRPGGTRAQRAGGLAIHQRQGTKINPSLECPFILLAVTLVDPQHTRTTMPTIEELQTELGLSKAQVAEFKEAFSKYAGKEGRVDAGGLTKILRSLGMKPPAEDIEEMINEVDVNAVETVSFEDFLVITNIIATRNKDTEKEVKLAFKAFDKDGSNSISVEELLKTMEELNTPLDKTIVEMYCNGDKDGDGELNFKEFQAMMGDPMVFNK